MPTLKHLLEELGILGVEPDEVRIPGTVYDNIVSEVSEEPDEDTGGNHHKEEG